VRAVGSTPGRGAHRPGTSGHRAPGGGSRPGSWPAQVRWQFLSSKVTLSAAGGRRSC